MSPFSFHCLFSWKSLGTLSTGPSFVTLTQHVRQLSPGDGCAFGCKPLYGLLQFELSHDVVIVVPKRGRHTHTIYWKPLLQLYTRDVPLAKNPSTGTAQQRLFLVLKVVLHAVVVISEILHLSTKSRCSRCCRHTSTVHPQLTGVHSIGETKDGNNNNVH